jgi:alkane 1-monooxygenase
MANRKYQILRHFDDSPQMPAGYPAMMLLSFFPPLWFMVMHKQIEKYKATQEGIALA